ncbi:MAG: hypothetical protein KDK51_09825 [Deltaproteobacteria bacterium]|nr:hypothetical protein [Deltaproteobacteria bacterium]
MNRHCMRTTFILLLHVCLSSRIFAQDLPCIPAKERFKINNEVEPQLVQKQKDILAAITVTNIETGESGTICQYTLDMSAQKLPWLKHDNIHFSLVPSMREPFSGKLAQQYENREVIIETDLFQAFTLLFEEMACATWDEDEDIMELYFKQLHHKTEVDGTGIEKTYRNVYIIHFERTYHLTNHDRVQFYYKKDKSSVINN